MTRLYRLFRILLLLLFFFSVKPEPGVVIRLALCESRASGLKLCANNNRDYGIERKFGSG